MSFLTATSTEVIYNWSAASTNLATFTTEDNLQKTYPPVIIPAGFWANMGSQGKSIRVRASGQLGSTSTPTFTFTLRLLTSTTWSAGGVSLGVSGAISANTTVTLAPWFLDAQIILRTLALGAASTVATMGAIYSGAAFSAGGAIPANNVAPTATTVDNSVTYYLFVSCACGTSNAANLINMQTLSVYGEN